MEEIAGERFDEGRHPRGVDSLIRGHAAVSRWARRSVDPPCPRSRLVEGVAERGGDISDRRAGPVGDHVGNLSSVAPSVAGVDVLDHLFASP